MTTTEYADQFGYVTSRPEQDYDGRWFCVVTNTHDGDAFVTYGVPVEVFTFYGIQR